MRNILLIIFIVGIYGCKKCADCTTTYVTETKEIDASNGNIIHEYTIPDDSPSTQEICGTQEIKDAEKGVTSVTIDSIGGLIVKKTKIGTCTCITK
jgi:hypothetical protein